MQQKAKTGPALALGIVVFLVAAVFVLINPLQVIQWKVSDLFFRSRPVSDLITIIAIDEKSISPEAQLGRFKDWPRSYYAQLLRTINANKPAVVAFDLDFRERSRGISALRLEQLLREYERRLANGSGGSIQWYDLLKRFEGDEHPDDADFQAALGESGPVVLATSLNLSDKSEGNAILSAEGVELPIFRGGNISAGFLNVVRDKDEILRRFTPRIDLLPHFSGATVAAAATAYKNELDIENLDQEMAISYTARPFSYRVIPFVDVMRGAYDASAIEGKIVLVGPTARILQDYHPTPTSRNWMAGVEINANIIQQLLDGRRVSEQGKAGALIITALLVLIGSFLMLLLSLRAAAAVFVIVLFGFPAVAFGMYQAGAVLNVVYPEIAWVFTGLAALWYRNKTELKAKKEIKKAFSHYVSPVVVEELAKDPSMLKLGGKRQKISVLFSDIVGFTTLAEKLTPEDTVALLNDYLTAMTEVIFGYNGTLDKYQGDAIMALFNAPLADEHHAVNACHTALAMRRALVALHEKWNAIPNLPFKEELIQLDFRVGIAGGAAVVGNVGSERRFDYTAIGDIVNLGSRLESLNKKYGTRIMVDKDTFTTVTENHNPFVYRKLDTVRVKGKKQETEVFELVTLSETITEEMKNMLDDFENGRILYTQRNFIEAKQYFESALQKISDDGPSQIYLNRCNFYLRKPPNRDWSPVVNLEEK